MVATSAWQRLRPGFSGWILIALAAGAACGVFFGDRVAFLDVVAQAFIRLLQMSVLPYVIVSLLAGLGGLGRREAALVARRGGAVLLVLWALTLAVIAAVPLAYPDWHSASFFSTTLVEPRPAMDFVSLYIPANPFRSLADNAVPAVVLFFIAVGVALIGLPGQEPLQQNLAVLSAALGRIAAFVARLAPIGVFAISASAAGTMSLEELGRLEVHVVTYVAAAVLMVFWVVPGLVAALTPLRHRQVLAASRDALVTAFSTGSTFIVLPMLADAAKSLLTSLRREREGESDAVVDVVVPVSFNFPNAGRLFSLCFVLFAAWLSGSRIPWSQYPELGLTGILSFFGNATLAVPFLLDLFRIPADMFQLFVAVGVVESRMATLLSAVHILALGVIAAIATTEGLVLHWGRLLRFAVVTVALLAVVVGGTRWLLSGAVAGAYQGNTFVSARALEGEAVPHEVRKEESASGPAQQAVGGHLGRIRRTGVLRVGYEPGGTTLPFVYWNSAGELVGFDVEMAHRLARDLGVSLRFVPYTRDRLGEHLRADDFDIAMSAVAVAPDRAQQMALSTPYMDLTFGFLVKDYRRAEFATMEQAARLRHLRVGSPPNPYYREKVHQFLPDATLVEVTDLAAVLAQGGAGLDAVVGGAESLSSWTLLYPQFSVVVPQPDPIRAPLAYAMPQGDPDWVAFVDQWLELKRRDNTIDTLYRYWILGRDEKRRRPRWSVIRDVLHWVE